MLGPQRIRGLNRLDLDNLMKSKKLRKEKKKSRCKIRKAYTVCIPISLHINLTTSFNHVRKFKINYTYKPEVHLETVFQ